MSLFIFRDDDDEDWNNVVVPFVPKTQQQLAIERAEETALFSQMDGFLSDFGKSLASLVGDRLEGALDQENPVMAKALAADRERLIDEARD